MESVFMVLAVVFKAYHFKHYVVQVYVKILFRYIKLNRFYSLVADVAG